MVERVPDKNEVLGSIPSAPTKHTPHRFKTGTFKNAKATNLDQFQIIVLIIEVIYTLSMIQSKKIILFIKTSSANKHTQQAMEAMLQALHRLLPQNTEISLEFVSSNQFLRFYIITLPEYKNIIQSQLYAQFPDAEIEETSEYLPKVFSETAVAQIDFRHSSFSPIKTYKNLEESFLKTFSALLATVDANDKVFLQLALRRVGSNPLKRGYKALHYSMFGKKYIGEQPTPDYEKYSKNLYIGKLRLAYTAKSKVDAEHKLNMTVNIFKSLKGNTNELKKKTFFVPNDIDQLFLSRSSKGGDYWSAEELATIYHFPFEGSLVSNVVQTTSKRSAAPDILPFAGLDEPNEVSLIGETTYRNEKKIFGIKRIDRRRHVYVIGKTGVGKSRFLELLMTSDIEYNKGFCLLDPHGDLAEAVLQRIPKERIKDVIYINPANRDFPIAFNPLEYTDNYEKRQHIAFFFISIFKKIFAADWNERMEHILRYIILALLETPDSNVLGITRIISDTTYRHRVINQLRDPVVKQFWANEFSSWNEQYSSQAIVPILNKVGQFISNPIIRNMVGQQKNALDFETFMNEGKIVIINVSKGKLGEDNAALLGSMFITKIQQAALARANIREEDRRDFYFYIDEFQNFATEAFKSILSESRKYRLNLTIAHQYIGQLSEDIRSSVFGNIASFFVFAVGGDDAAYLEKEFTPIFTADDILRLEAREMYVKMSINGRTAQPFSARTLTTQEPQFNFVPEIVSNTQTKFATNRIAVERNIEKWQNSKGSVTDDADSDGFPEPIL